MYIWYGLFYVMVISCNVTYCNVMDYDIPILGAQISIEFGCQVQPNTPNASPTKSSAEEIKREVRKNVGHRWGEDATFWKTWGICLKKWCYFGWKKKKGSFLGLYGDFMCSHVGFRHDFMVILPLTLEISMANWEPCISTHITK